LSFWQGGAGLSFLALLWKNVVCVAASDGKTRYGPFVSFNNVSKFSKWIFEDCKIFKNYESYKIYEGSCVA